ncbi:plasmid pRiA4b ORF-3 family protein, partial [Streptomyces carpinensis]
MTARRSPGERTASVHQLKVDLVGMKPPVWRRLVVPSDITLGSLHDVVQVAFGWEGMHLHVFEGRSGGRYAPPEDLDIPVFDEEEAALADVLPGTGDRMDYTYDFGDGWLHRIRVEAVCPAREGEGEHAVCTGGRRAMPPAEDLGGVWGLAGLLERYADGERPSPMLVRHGGEEWVEYDGLHDEVLAGLYAEGFDPAAFDPAELTGELAQVPLRRAVGTQRKKRGGPGGGQAPRGMYQCECGALHPLPGGAGPLAEDDGPDDEVSLSDVLDAVGLRLPAVRLPGEVELARSVREVPAFMAAVRLGHWCGDGRELTPKEVLRPKLARQAVEEAELWRVDPDEWGDAGERAARLAKVRSAADMEPLALPWDWALNCGFVEVEGNRAYAGDELPDQDDDAALLAAWQEAVVGAAVELSLSFPALDELLGGLQPLRELAEEAPPLVFLMLITAYGLPDGEWLDVAGFLTDGMEGLSEGPARRLVSALLVDQYHDTARTLELFGAAEREGHEPLVEGAALTLLLDGPDG